MSFFNEWAEFILKREILEFLKNQSKNFVKCAPLNQAENYPESKNKNFKCTFTNNVSHLKRLNSLKNKYIHLYESFNYIEFFKTC